VLQATSVRRTVDLPLPVDEAWPAIAGPGELGEWLGDEVEVELQPGSAGHLLDDDGERRTIVVREVEPERRVSFTWWRDADPDAASTVELVLVPTADGSRLTVTETMVVPARGTTGSTITAFAGSTTRLAGRVVRAVRGSRSLVVHC
jgi:uncharacterized protein YndB with AHSA1/START domain